jgi:hypothetical protein
VQGNPDVRVIPGRRLLKGRLIMLVLLDGSMWEGGPLYTCSH